MKHSGAPSTGDIIKIDYQFGDSRYALVVDERGREIRADFAGFVDDANRHFSVGSF